MLRTTTHNARGLKPRLLAAVLCVWFLLPTICMGLSHPVATAPTSSCHESAPSSHQQTPAPSPECCVSNQHQQAAVTTDFYPQWVMVPVELMRGDVLRTNLVTDGTEPFRFAPASPPVDQTILRI